MPSVLVACEFSGTVRDAFRRHGIEAWSCDIIAGDPASCFHLQRDVTELLRHHCDPIIAHPPCTYITNAGVRHLHSIPSRNGILPKVHGEASWAAMREATTFFNRFLNADCPRICVENPIPHRYAKEDIGEYTQLIQPWMFGHYEQKGTCLWLKGLPKLVPTDVVGPPPKVKTAEEKRTWNRIHNVSPGPDRQKIRSITYAGIAEAMADQWAPLL